MKQENSERRFFIKTAILTGFLGYLTAFNPLKKLIKIDEKKRFEVKIHPKAIRRTFKG